VNLTAGAEPGHDKRCHCHKPVINVSFTEGKRKKRERRERQRKESGLRKTPWENKALLKGYLSI